MKIEDKTELYAKWDQNRF